MIQGLDQLQMGAPGTLIPENCRKSQPGPNGTSPGAPDPKTNRKEQKNYPYIQLGVLAWQRLCGKYQAMAHLSFTSVLSSASPDTGSSLLDLWSWILDPGS